MKEKFIAQVNFWNYPYQKYVLLALEFVIMPENFITTKTQLQKMHWIDSFFYSVWTPKVVAERQEHHQAVSKCHLKANICKNTWRDCETDI